MIKEIMNEELSVMAENYAPQERQLLEKAYKIADQTLADIQRGNGHRFIEHPAGVALIVAGELGLRADAVTAVFLHEATRGNPRLFEKVKREFSPQIMTIVEGLNNISTITPKETKLQAENYRKLIVSYSKDPRVTLIKLADRLEVMRHLEYFPKGSIKRKITETIMLYAPLAHQLGLYNIKNELEDLYFKYSDPENYRAITNKLITTKSDREKLAEQFIKPLEETLSQRYTYKLKIRTKTAYSIWRKMQKQGVPFEGVFDVFAIRFIVDAPPEREIEHAFCWDIYSEVTKEYKPDTSRLRDWISHPKPNGYESLHITVENREGARIEVQIRTARMDEIAENGHAAHWSYKGIKNEQNLDRWLLNVKKMLESPDQSQYSSTLFSDLNEIFVFTPAGDLKELPKGATILDFAFNIHSNLGVKCSGAKVNGKVVSIREELHTGDVVEIMSNKNQKPSADWLNIVVSPKARNRIKNKLKEEEGKMSSLGHEILERRMKNWKMELTDDILSDLTRHFKKKTISDFCIAIGNEQIDALEIKNYLTAESTAPRQESGTAVAEGETRKERVKKNESLDYLIINDKVDNIGFKMAKCCNPIFGDDVFGFVSSAGGIKIHRISCPNASRLLEKYPYRIQKVKWRELSESTRFQAALKVIVEGELSAGNEIIESLNRQKASIRNFNIEERSAKRQKGEFNILMNISVSNNGHLDRVISDIKKIKGVKTIIRSSVK